MANLLACRYLRGNETDSQLDGSGDGTCDLVSHVDLVDIVYDIEVELKFNRLTSRQLLK